MVSIARRTSASSNACWEAAVPPARVRSPLIATSYISMNFPRHTDDVAPWPSCAPSLRSRGAILQTLLRLASSFFIAAASSRCRWVRLFHHTRMYAKRQAMTTTTAAIISTGSQRVFLPLNKGQTVIPCRHEHVWHSDMLWLPL